LDVARAYFFARDALLAGPQRLRDLYLNAMRRQAPIPLVEKAMLELGATFTGDEAGGKIVIPPASFATGDFVRSGQPVLVEPDQEPRVAPALLRAASNAKA
jgi:hypothetical protein